MLIHCILISNMPHFSLDPMHQMYTRYMHLQFLREDHIHKYCKIRCFRLKDIIQKQYIDNLMYMNSNFIKGYEYWFKKCSGLFSFFIILSILNFCYFVFRWCITPKYDLWLVAILCPVLYMSFFVINTNMASLFHSSRSIGLVIYSPRSQAIISIKVHGINTLPLCTL